MRFAAPACAVFFLAQAGSAEAPGENPAYRGQLVFTRIRYGASADAFSYFGGRSTWSPSGAQVGADLGKEDLADAGPVGNENVHSVEILSRPAGGTWIGQRKAITRRSLAPGASQSADSSAASSRSARAIRVLYSTRPAGWRGSRDP